jgi:hypothetical protein
MDWEFIAKEFQEAETAKDSSCCCGMVRTGGGHVCTAHGGNANGGSAYALVGYVSILLFQAQWILNGT